MSVSYRIRLQMYSVLLVRQPNLELMWSPKVKRATYFQFFCKNVLVNDFRSQMSVIFSVSHKILVSVYLDDIRMMHNGMLLNLLASYEPVKILGFVILMT